MPLPEKSYTQLVNDQAAAMQASTKTVLDFSIGAILRALIETNAGNGLWLESVAIALLAITRLQTSTGNDVDTFVNQFRFYRNPATPSLGTVTFSRFSATVEAKIYSATINLATLQQNISSGNLDPSTLGALVYSTTNQITYSVYTDTNNTYYSSSLNAYVVPIGLSNIDIPVIAITPGSIGNVISNQINTISSVINGIDTVNNSQPFTGGINQESDDSVKIRFPLYLASLFKANKQAIEYAVSTVEGVVRYKVFENIDVEGNILYGFFWAVVDDGTGNASSDLLANVATAVEAMRGLTISFSVYAPIPVPVNIVCDVITDGSIPDTVVQSAVIAGYDNFISTQSFESIFPYSEVPRIAYDKNSSLSGGNNYSPITNFKNWTLNGSSSADIQLIRREIMTVGTITVNMNV